jgi:hypothetical protein
MLNRFVGSLRRVPPRNWIFLLAGLVVALGVVAIGARTASRRGYLSAPSPMIREDIAPPPAPEASTIAAPITLPLHTLSDQLEGAVPVRFGTLDERIRIPTDDRKSLAFELDREPFRVTLSGNVARLEATIGYALRAWYDPPVLPEVSGSCGTGNTPKPRLKVVIEAPISVQDDWTLHTRSRIVSIERASDAPRDQCRMTFLGFDITDRVVDGARGFLEKHTRDIDAAAASVGLRARVEGWWRTLQEPIRLSDSLWLVFRPESIRRGDARGTGDLLEIPLSMNARPAIVVGPRPVLAPSDLPRLDTGAVATGLDLIVDAYADYDAVTGFLQDELGGAEVSRAGTTMRIDSLRVFGIGGGRVALEVLTSGDVVTHLFLTGTPRLDPKTGQFTIPDLDYDVRTRSVLIATLSWLANRRVRDFVRERASWPATPAVGWLHDRLLEGLNRDLSDELRVAGQVGEIKILGLYATKEVLLVRVTATGSAELFVVDRGGG